MSRARPFLTETVRVQSLMLYLFALLCLCTLGTDTVAVQALRQVHCRKGDQNCLANCLRGGASSGDEKRERCNAAALSGHQLHGQLICRPDRYLSPLTNVTVTLETDTTAELSWLYSLGQGDLSEDVKIRYECSIDNLHTLAQLQGLSHGDWKLRRSGWSIPESGQLRLVDLLPVQSYSCSMWAQQGAKRSRPAAVRFSTKFGKPQLPVADLRVRFGQAASTSALQLRWTVGLQENLQPSYQVTIERPLNVTFVTRNTSVSLTIASRILVSQHPRAGFLRLLVLPFNAMGSGPATVVEAALPPYPDNSGFLKAGSSCREGRMVHWFDDANASASRGLQDSTATSSLCLSEEAYRQCQTE